MHGCEFVFNPCAHCFLAFLISGRCNRHRDGVCVKILLTGTTANHCMERTDFLTKEPSLLRCPIGFYPDRGMIGFPLKRYREVEKPIGYHTDNLITRQAHRYWCMFEIPLMLEIADRDP